MKQNELSVDNHEPQNMIDYFRDLGWVVHVEHLKVGDCVRGNAVVERKEINDAVLSIRSGRLWEQLINMKNNYKYCYLAVSGRESQIRRWQDVKPLMGALARVSKLNGSGHGFGIPVLMAENDRGLAYMIHSVLKDVDESKRPQKVVRRPRRQNNQEIREDMFCTIPTIGLKTSQALLQGGTVEDICLLPRDEITQRIGKIKGERVVKVIFG